MAKRIASQSVVPGIQALPLLCHRHGNDDPWVYKCCHVEPPPLDVAFFYDVSSHEVPVYSSIDHSKGLHLKISIFLFLKTNNCIHGAAVNWLQCDKSGRIEHRERHTAGISGSVSKSSQSDVVICWECSFSTFVVCGCVFVVCGCVFVVCGCVFFLYSAQPRLTCPNYWSNTLYFLSKKSSQSFHTINCFGKYTRHWLTNTWSMNSRAIEFAVHWS